MAVPHHPSENQYFEPDADEQLLGKVQAPLDEMPTTDFSSSNVHSGLYDFGERTLYLRFLRQMGADAIYRYDDVPAREWQGLKAAGSKGSYVNANIATKYNYVRINRGDIPQEDRQNAANNLVRRFVCTP